MNVDVLTDIVIERPRDMVSAVGIRGSQQNLGDGHFVSARKTRSSTGMPGTKTVALVAPGRATWLALPLNAGPPGFASAAGPSPGCSEIRVVFGAHLAAPKHVSRTKTCR